MLKINANNIFKNLSFAFIANLIGLITSSIITFILPKYLGVLQYSYYQLYLFYASYIGFLGLGWIDGFYLRYAGKYFDKINKNLISAEFKYFSLFEIFISFLLCIFIFLQNFEPNKIIIFISIAICICIYLPRALFHNLLLSVGKIKEYAITIIIEKTIQIICIALSILLHKNIFYWFIIADILGRLCASVYIYTLCRHFIFTKPSRFQIIKKEIFLNIQCGIFLMFSNVASLLIIGTIRQFIEIFWNIETFGKISLVLSLSNFILIFINSISMVIFPIIKRCEKSDTTILYKKIRVFLIFFIFLILNFYIPIKYIFSIWLPEYSESLKYLSILFPICAYECRMNLLINNFFKSFRLEKKLLLINVTTLIASLSFSYITCKVIHNLDYAVISIIILLAFRCILSEVLLSKKIPIKVLKDNILESIIISIFIYANWNYNAKTSFVVYLLAFIVYMLFKYRYIKNILYNK